MSADLPIAADTASVVVLDKISKYVLLAREKDGSVWWPGGKLEQNEIPIAAAIRELEEETGLTLTARRRILPYGHFIFCTGGYNWLKNRSNHIICIFKNICPYAYLNN